MKKRPSKPQVTENLPKGLTKKEQYYYAIEQGLCTACFEPNDNLPKRKCKECSEIVNHNYRVKHHENKKKGLCHCGHERVEGRAKCANCLESTRLATKRYREAKESNGLCRWCGKELDPDIDVNEKTGEILRIHCRECEDKRKQQPSYRKEPKKNMSVFRKLPVSELQTDNIEKMNLYHAMEENKVAPMTLAKELGVTNSAVLRWVFHEKTRPMRDIQIALNEYFGKEIYKMLNVLEETPQEKAQVNKTDQIDQIELEIKQGIVCERCWKPIKDNKIPGHTRKCVFCEIKLREEEIAE